MYFFPMASLGQLIPPFYKGFSAERERVFVSSGAIFVRGIHVSGIIYDNKACNGKGKHLHERKSLITRVLRW